MGFLKTILVFLYSLDSTTAALMAKRSTVGCLYIPGMD